MVWVLGFRWRWALGGSIPGTTYCCWLLLHDSGHVSTQSSNGMYAPYSFQCRFSIVCTLFCVVPCHFNHTLLSIIHLWREWALIKVEAWSGFWWYCSQLSVRFMGIIFCGSVYMLSWANFKLFSHTKMFCMFWWMLELEHCLCRSFFRVCGEACISYIWRIYQVTWRCFQLINISLQQ